MTTMLLKNLINNLDPKIANERVNGISSDSRKVKKGDLFISIKGNKEQLLEVEKIIKSLMSHYHKFGKIDKKTVLSHINNGFSNEENESIVYGSSGKRIYAKTSIKKRSLTYTKKMICFL